MQDHETRPLAPAALWTPQDQAPLVPAPEVTLYPVPVPGAQLVTLPDGRTAYARPVQANLDPVPLPEPSPPMPAWAKGMALVAAALAGGALAGALALRVAAPALADTVDMLTALWRLAIGCLAILLGVGVMVRLMRGGKKTARSAERARHAGTAPAGVHIGAVHGGTGGAGGRTFSRGGKGGDVNINISQQF
ncbi:hypothetical protein [Streptomyces violascens]|uniref:hypothetical protein n=1 Tax=Streptomyces violascens TaxID=67381 RepID=UPI0036C3248B